MKMKLAYIQFNDGLLPSILGTSIYNNFLIHSVDSLAPLIPFFLASWGVWGQIGHSGGYEYLWGVQLFLQQVTGSGEDDRKQQQLSITLFLAIVNTTSFNQVPWILLAPKSEARSL